MKYVIGVLGIIVAGYVGVQSIIIANVGAQNQIPQLEGDGGASVVFSAILLIAAVISLFRPFISSPIFLLSTLSGILCAVTYSDNLMFVWSIVSFLFCVFSYLVHRFYKRLEPSN